jgi:VWFA-related protein
MQTTSFVAAFILVFATALAAPLAASAAQEQAPPAAVRNEGRQARSPEQLTAAVNSLAPRYRQWVYQVAGLISEAELEYFLDIQEDYRRDAFMEAFWRPRDPDPTTAVNELRARWQNWVAQAGAQGLPYGDPRFVVLLLNGPPGRYSLSNGQPVSRCFSRNRELEIWFYGNSERTSSSFIVIFFKPGAQAPYEIWNTGANMRAVPRSGGLPTTDINLLCADDLLRYALREISNQAGYERLIEEITSPSIPSLEWLATFSGSTTDLPAGAQTLAVPYEISHPTRNQSRTALQVLLRVPLDKAPGRVFDGQRFHDFRVRGEVIRDGRLFESFQYHFEGPTPEGATEIPVGFTRYLRPGEATLRVLLEDVFGGQYAQFVRDLDVPSPEGLPTAARPQLAGVGDAASSGPSIRLLPPSGSIHTGMVRFRTRANGSFDKVAFFLDGRQVISKRRPPYSVELNLGEAPAPHSVRAVAYRGDEEISTDQLWLNQGNQRFLVRFLEPRSGGLYPGGLTARVQVDTPDGQPPQRVELMVNDEVVATLGEGPWEQRLSLGDDRATVVRAVAYLADGTSAEDAVLVNSSDFGEQLSVELVEVYAVVLDGRGRPVTGLERNAFRVLENGTPQTLQRFEETADAPIHAALLIDRSSSMEAHLPAVSEAAFSFADDALVGDDDRIAVLSFAEEATIDSGFTDSRGQVERALAGLDALGGTGLYDAVVQGLNYFQGITGQNALVLFSDGRDEGSQLRLEQAVEGARRAGVTIYAIGLESSFQSRDDRRALEDLAEDTGGRALFLADLAGLQGAYDEILAELRSRYLLAYQSTSDEPQTQFRTIRVEVDERGTSVRTRRGYFP